MEGIRNKLGSQTEEKACRLLSSHGWWCHRFERKANGSQPCDIVAMKKGSNWLLDGKHCAKPYLATQRIEANQLTCFKMAQSKGIPCGFVCEHQGALYYIPFEEVDFKKSYQRLGRKFEDEIRDRE